MAKKNAPTTIMMVKAEAKGYLKMRFAAPLSIFFIHFQRNVKKALENLSAGKLLKSSSNLNKMGTVPISLYPWKMGTVPIYYFFTILYKPIVTKGIIKTIRNPQLAAP